MQPACRLKIGNIVPERYNLRFNSLTNWSSQCRGPSAVAARLPLWRRTSMLRHQWGFKLLP